MVSSLEEDTKHTRNFIPLLTELLHQTSLSHCYHVMLPNMQFPVTQDIDDLLYSAYSLRKPHGVGFASLNIQSLIHKLDDVHALLLQSELDCLCLQESFLKSVISNEEISIPGYNVFRFDRTCNSGKSSGGGLVVYTRSNREFHVVEDSHICTPNIEAVWLKLSLKKARDTYVCCVYRPLMAILI